MSTTSATADVSFIREVECGGKMLQVKQLYVGDVGCVVWDAALVLCRYYKIVCRRVISACAFTQVSGEQEAFSARVLVWKECVGLGSWNWSG